MSIGHNTEEEESRIVSVNSGSKSEYQTYTSLRGEDTIHWSNLGRYFDRTELIPAPTTVIGAISNF